MKYFLRPLMVLVCLLPAHVAFPQAQPPVMAGIPVDFSGLVDVYYSANLNHPAARFNQLRNFDLRANQFSLNMAKLTVAHDPDPVGFRIDAGFGRAFEILHATEQAPQIFRHVPQAYLSWKPPQAKGLQVDLGKFYTSAGAERAETYLNWNYSRSFIFSQVNPYYHFGLRASMPVRRNFSAGFQLLNGWNNVEDNNSGKTIGVTAAVSTEKVDWVDTYYYGPEKTDTNDGPRSLYDTVLQVRPMKRLHGYVNFAYGADKAITGGNQTWTGLAAAARLSVNGWLAVSPRIEWFHDRDGFQTGTAQRLKEFTLTAEIKLAENLLVRPEYRRDWSDQPFFDRGNNISNHRNQDTLLVGVVAFLGPRR